MSFESKAKQNGCRRALVYRAMRAFAQTVLLLQEMLLLHMFFKIGAKKCVFTMKMLRGKTEGGWGTLPGPL